MLAAARSALSALFSPAQPTEPARPAPIAEKHIRPALIGRGSVDPTHREGQRRIVVTVDEDLFERIRARAVGRKVPMAAEIRQLLLCALNAEGAP